ncbi:MAG: DUF3500 domain-containing protein [Pseudomonadota bacterium]
MAKLLYPTRRAVLAQGSGAALALSAPFAAATSVTPSLGQLLIDRVTAWLDMLDGPQRDRAVFDFGSRQRRRWNYMWGSAVPSGLTLEDMTDPQKDAARDVLSTMLSTDGFQTAENIMLQQDIMRDEWGKGSPDRNRERFSLSVFGTPSPTEAWGWRWEGHHLTITVTLLGDQIISQTPKAFSSEPNTVPSGPHKGLVVLENEALGRALFADLGPANRQAALLNDSSYGNILTKPGREDRIKTREGVALGDLSTSQADAVRRLIAIYTSDYLTGPLADAQIARISLEDEAAIRFGWAGPNQDDESFYYRIHGETFLIEFATLFNQPQHHHTIVHDLQQNFGDHRLS